MPGGILALDPATGVTGWAYADPGGKPEWGEIAIKQPDETFRDHGGRIGMRFSLFLEARIEVFLPAHIVREDVYVGGGTKPMNPETILALAGLALLIDTIAERRGIAHHKTQSSEFIKAFTGRGKYPNTPAKKRATMATCKLMGWSVSDHNAADALALLWYYETVVFREMRLSMKRPAGPLFALDSRGRSAGT